MALSERDRKFLNYLIPVNLPMQPQQSVTAITIKTHLLFSKITLCISPFLKGVWEEKNPVTHV